MDKNNGLNKTNGMSKKKKNNFFSSLSFGLMLIIIILSLVVITRLAYQNPVFPNGESYYNLHIAEALSQDLSLIQDPVQETVYEPNPYHYLLAVLLIIIPAELLSIYLPLLFGVLCGFIFYRLILLIGVKPRNAAYAIIVLSVTPAFIVLFTGLYVLGFVILLSLLSLLLALKNKWNKRKCASQTFCTVLCTLLFILLALTSLTGFILTILILLILCMALKKKIRVFYVPVIISVLAALLLKFLTSYVPRILGFHSFTFPYSARPLALTFSF